MQLMILESDIFTFQCCSQNMLFTSNALKITSFKIIQANGLLLNVETGSQKLVILSYATVCLHPSVSLNNEKNCRAISEDKKIAVCEKTAGLRSGNSSDLDSASVVESVSFRKDISDLRYA